ncbi:phosphoribosylformylglycinamidine cyclo-ligase [Enterococcus saccharolyticus]|uniref:Phosphoribosylformylglycinamidine cyclo-ligase n=1 Tax=Enterococcus saccharolyticus subsp. saccharolyticus ATCC 43076 TaxID=1139996 RepID=S0JBI4_9ENTE|nr:phosphoribosylformylglycinamidine cyclo-ligase [Enterococcus saccharolyticus]EOT29722.1 phosphoribosylformylglycinamidine cyclo-ligase [Enterococcus saccharolyticus subsp. saccharolyticus ATCC 43076]EOT80882.1 phosphoribosylformylglycinamidine cyclo-ligase [Enterococcus saccharolyticus subsp. saccharolyticus ATCC 43076]OJG89658.1 phosphoribosylformylglycinamidine cyclo-ligase [Enterococcus saccharolyticus]
MTNAYSKAGVDVEAGYEVVERIKKHVKKTERLGVLGSLGGFGGCFDLSTLSVKEPVLVSGTDGVGTKLMIAIQTETHDTIGIDCVAMCVNDIVAQGAEPLYFLDYIATGKNVPERLEKVVAGVADGCVQAGAALIGGETAEMPGMYKEDEYDLAGFAVGIAEKSQLVTGEKIKAGDVLIGLPSSGIHSNGFSLVRKIFFEQHQFTYEDQLPELSQALGKELLTPTRIYVQAILPLVKEELVHGIAHVTGGGFVENLPRMLPENLAVEIHENSWPILPIFEVLSSYGKLPKQEMYEIFNMGIGMVIAVAPEKVSDVQVLLQKQNEASYVIGQVIEKAEAPIVFKEVHV